MTCWNPKQSDVAYAAVDTRNGWEWNHSGLNRYAARSARTIMGSAGCWNNLASGDGLTSVLRAGDHSRSYTGGNLYLTRGLKRFRKMFDKRFNLGRKEKTLSECIPSAAACCHLDDLLLAAVEQCADPLNATESICQIFGLPQSVANVVSLSKMPQAATESSTSSI